MKRTLIALILTFSLAVPLASQVFGAVTTLAWDGSPSPGVTGYKVYYKQNDTNLPFDGIGANEGSSPVDVGNVLTATITGLSDNIPYYFAVTAYDAAGRESSYSNISSSRWMPQLLTPSDRAIDEPIATTFQWSTAPAELDLRYILYYGTDPDLVAAAAPLIIRPPESANRLFLISFLLLALPIFFLRQICPKTSHTVAAAGFALCLALTACGGGGGGDDTSPARGTEDTSPAPDYQTVYSVNVGTGDYHQVFDLQPATTYYWKVVGTDISDPAQTYSSSTFQFTTEIF